jgi:hypothetical protein
MNKQVYLPDGMDDEVKKLLTNLKKEDSSKLGTAAHSSTVNFVFKVNDLDRHFSKKCNILHIVNLRMFLY